MSRNILDELYDYDLFHLTEIEDMDGSYKAALDRLVKAEALFLMQFIISVLSQWPFSSEFIQRAVLIFISLIGKENRISCIIIFISCSLSSRQLTGITFVSYFSVSVSQSSLTS